MKVAKNASAVKTNLTSASLDKSHQKVLVGCKQCFVCFDILYFSEQPTPTPQLALSYTTKENIDEDQVMYRNVFNKDVKGRGYALTCCEF